LKNNLSAEYKLQLVYMK